MRPQTIIKIANITRKYSHYHNPLAYRMARTVLRRIYPVQPPDKSLNVVTEYDQGLIHINTMYRAERDILFFGGVEPGISSLIKRQVMPGDVCLDIGANIGALSLLMAFSTGPSGKVIAFEPHPVIRNRLKMNIALNHLEHVDIVPAAISDTTGTATLHATSESHYHQGGSSLRPSNDLENRYEISTIDGHKVEEILDGLNCKLIKIDVEGHDGIVLKELAGIIEGNRPTVIFEYEKSRWAEHGCTIDQAFDLFSDLDYQYYKMKKDLLYPTDRHVSESCDIICVAR